MKYRITLSVLVTLLLMSGCAEQESRQVDVQTGSKPVVYVSNYPLHYFIERIAGDLVDIRFPVGVSGDPALWKPGAEDIAAMQQGDLILLNGASYEQWLSHVTLPQSRVIDTAAAFSDTLIPTEETISHTHGPEGEHAHEGTAFTTWLDLTLALEQARAVRQALIVLRPQQRAQIDERFTPLEKELTALDAEIKSTAASAPEIRVIFSHPVYQYFKRRYGVQGTSVHWEPDVMPDEKMWNEFQQLLKEQPAKWMLWEGEPLPEIVERLSGLGVESVVVNPCGNTPDSGDFLSVMRQNIESLKRVFP